MAAARAVAEDVEDRVALVVGHVAALHDDVLVQRRHPLRDLAQKRVAREKCEIVPVARAGDVGDVRGDAVVVVRAVLVRRVDLRDDDDLPVRARERRRQRQLRRPLRRHAEKLFVEVEGLERRRQRDRGVRGVEDLAEEARRVLAEDLELDAVGGPLDEVRELVPLLGQEVRQLHQLEVEVDQRIVFLDDAVLDLPADVVDDEALPLQALREEEVAVRLAEADGLDLLGERVQVLAKLLEQLLVAVEVAVAPREVMANRLERFLVDLRRVVATAAVDKVVGLVDDEHAVAVVALLLVGLQADVRIEDVVVVADDDVGLLDELERDLERTDLGRLCQLVGDVRVVVRHRRDDAREEAATVHLLRVALGEWAEVLVADHLRVRAHFLFCADAQDAKRAVVEHRQRAHGGVLLQGFRGEEEELLAEAQRLFDRGIERGDGLADAGRRGDQQRLAVADRARDGVDHLRLVRPQFFVRKFDGVGEGLLRREEGVLGLDGVEGLVDGVLDAGRLERGLDALGLAAAEVDEDELRREGPAVELRLPREGPCVDEELQEVSPQLVGAAQRLQLELEVNRLHFFDGDYLLLRIDGKPIDPPSDRDRPPPSLDAMDDVDLGAVVGVRGRAELRAALVDVLPDPHPPEPVAALDADAPVGRFVDEVPNGADDLALLVVNAHAMIDDNRSRRRPAGRQGAVPAPAHRYNHTMRDTKPDRETQELLRDIRIAMAQIKSGQTLSNREAKAELRRRFRQ